MPSPQECWLMVMISEILLERRLYYLKKFCWIFKTVTIPIQVMTLPFIYYLFTSVVLFHMSVFTVKNMFSQRDHSKCCVQIRRDQFNSSFFKLYDKSLASRIIHENLFNGWVNLQKFTLIQIWIQFTFHICREVCDKNCWGVRNIYDYVLVDQRSVSCSDLRGTSRWQPRSALVRGACAKLSVFTF